jgi:hypothetical protein
MLYHLRFVLLRELTLHLRNVQSWEFIGRTLYNYLT